MACGLPATCAAPIGDQTMADAMLDRLMQSHHRFALTGESLRKKSSPAKGSTDN